MDELVTWMRHGKLAAAGKMLRDIRSARGTPEELVEKRKALFDEHDEILQCAKAPPQVMPSSSKLVEYLGGADKQVVVVDEPDPQTAEDLHAAWFTALTESTRESTKAAHALQVLLAENAKFMGPDSSAATSLTQAWLAAELALEA